MFPSCIKWHTMVNLGEGPLGTVTPPPIFYFELQYFVSIREEVTL